MSVKVTPLYNQVLVRPIPIDFKTKGGIMIVESGTRAITAQMGEVVAVGCGMIQPNGGLMPLQVKVGDVVLYVRGSGFELKTGIDSEALLLFKEGELMGIVERSLEDAVKNIPTTEVPVVVPSVKHLVESKDE